jgi:transcriptional regulator with XRE-family HTH domain
VLTNQAVGQRIAYERRERGWTLQGLAKHMEEVGCPIGHTAIHKIERGGEQQRKVSFEEAVAFAEVFGLGLKELAVPPALARRRDVRLAVDELFAAIDAGKEASRRQTAAEERLTQLVAGDADLVDALLAIVEPTRVHGESLLLTLGVLTLDADDNIVMTNNADVVMTEKERTRGQRRKKA